ncbi:MAG TPA: PIN domain nuclease [Acidimicrobiales bacterium]|nr:PIN domain nuclease [Acidimicrobiales bacterium]
MVDTSAWIEFLRDTGSSVCNEVDRLLATDFAVCDAVRMEVLAGARDDAHLRQLRGLLARATVLPTEPLDYETAASLCRTCRRSGETVGKVIDCLVGAVAVRHDASILHADADFSTLALHTAVEVHEPPA